MTKELDDEFQPDEDVTEEFEKPRRSGGMVVSTRIDAEDADKLVALAEESGRTVSQVARQAIRAFVAFGTRRPEAQEVTATADVDAGVGLMVRTEGTGTATYGMKTEQRDFVPA